MKNVLRVETECELEILEKFIIKCKELGYINNSSIESLKYDFLTKKLGKFFYVFKGDELISLSGCHLFDVFDDDSFRVCFRGVQLPKMDVYKGISKYHFNSIPWRVCLPYQVKHSMSLGIDSIYITTNKDRFDGRFNKTDRVLFLLSKLSIVDFVDCRVIYETQQNIWKLNLEKYCESRKLEGLDESF